MGSGSPPGGLGWVGRPFRRAGRVREGQQVLGGPTRWTGGIGKLSRRAGKHPDALPEYWVASVGPSGVL